MTYIGNRDTPEFWKFDDSMICAVSINRKKIADTCTGDSGGPLIKEVLTVMLTVGIIFLCQGLYS